MHSARSALYASIVLTALAVGGGCEFIVPGDLGAVAGCQDGPGDICPGGQICRVGRCVPTCDPNVQSNMCGTGFICHGGICVATCAADSTTCGEGTTCDVDRGICVAVLADGGTVDPGGDDATVGSGPGKDASGGGGDGRVPDAAVITFEAGTTGASCTGSGDCHGNTICADGTLLTPAPVALP